MTAKMTPLGINTLASLLNSKGFWINKPTSDLMGISVTDGSYTRGSIITDTILNKFYNAVSLAYAATTNSTLSSTTYNNLIQIGSASIPAFSLGKPASYTDPYTGANTRYSFLYKIARQASDEFKYASGSYSDFVQSFSRCHSFLSITNRVILSMTNAPQFLIGHFSNMNDLITGDVSGISRSTLLFGQDLIRTGRVIDLSKLDGFGKPSVLLSSIYENEGLSDYLTQAIIDAGISVDDLNLILSGTIPTIIMEKQLYTAYTTVVGDNLEEILITLNCQTSGLVSLADLLDIKKLFPYSYISLTVPNYNVQPPTGGSKSYVLLYNNGTVNSQLRTLNYSDYLTGLVPPHIELPAANFSVALFQIKNITQMSVEKLAQVITNLENVNDLDLPDGGNKPINQTLVDSALPLINKGSGPSGTYRMTDFFGSMSGIPYNFPLIKEKIISLTNPKITKIYNDIELLLNSPIIPPATSYDSQLGVLINLANAELLSIKNNNVSDSSILNSAWDNVGKQLLIEIASRNEAIPEPASVIKSSKLDIYGFSDAINSYSKETDYGAAAPVLEKIADLTSAGGNSMIAAMRESRNSARLDMAGGTLDNGIPVTIETPISDVVTINSSFNVPTISINNISGAIVSTGTNVVDSNGNVNVSVIPVGSSGINSTPNGLNLGVGSITTIEKSSGETSVIGSMGGSPYTNLIPSNLDLFKTINNISHKIELPHQSVEEILRCYCEC